MVGSEFGFELCTLFAVFVVRSDTFTLELRSTTNALIDIILYAVSIHYLHFSEIMPDGRPEILVEGLSFSDFLTKGGYLMLKMGRQLWKFFHIDFLII